MKAISLGGADRMQLTALEHMMRDERVVMIRTWPGSAGEAEQTCERSRARHQL